MYTSGNTVSLPRHQLLAISWAAALEPPDRLFLLDATQLALGNKPAFSSHGAQDAAFGNLFSETLEQLILRLVLA